MEGGEQSEDDGGDGEVLLSTESVAERMDIRVMEDLSRRSLRSILMEIFAACIGLLSRSEPRGVARSVRWLHFSKYGDARNEKGIAGVGVFRS